MTTEVAPARRGETRTPALARGLGAALFASLLAGCAMVGADGPTSRQVNSATKDASAEAYGIKVVEVDDAVVRRIVALDSESLFSESFGEGQPVGATVGAGDVLDVAIWEAPPAMLFGAIGGAAALGLPAGMTQSTMPEQMVDPQGNIRIPFIGPVRAVGRSPEVIAADIMRRLRGKAHEPQVIVRVARNQSAMATVVGDGTGSARVPLTTKGERILDALAVAGGGGAAGASRQPVNKTTVQLTRGNTVQSMPLERIIQEPRQNIILQPGDVVTALFQPLSFTVLGAANRNEELSFEGQGITLAQALGRIGGLQNQRANARGVFIFRFEDPAALDAEMGADVRTTQAGKVPVIYRIDLKDPKSFFVAQGFPVRNKDVLYVSSAPFAELQKVVSIIASTVLPIVAIDNAISRN